MPSKMVIDRQKRTIQILAAGQQHRDRIQKVLEERLSPLLKRGQKMPDVGLLLDLMLAMVAADLGGMLAADEEHIRELGDDDEYRERRDAGMVALYDSLSALQEIATGLFGAGILTALHLDVMPAKDPSLVSGKAREVSKALREKPLPASRIPDAKLNAEDWARRLDKERAVIDKAIVDVARELREAETTLVAKNNSIDLHDRDQRSYAAVLSGLLDFIGEPEQSDRVRPSERKPRRSRGGGDGEGGGEGGGGGDEGGGGDAGGGG